MRIGLEPFTDRFSLPDPDEPPWVENDAFLIYKSLRAPGTQGTLLCVCIGTTKGFWSLWLESEPHGR